MLRMPKVLLLFAPDVTAQNLKSDRFHHFNILQQEECEAFAHFAGTLAQKVTAENGESKNPPTLSKRERARPTQHRMKPGTGLPPVSLGLGAAAV